MSKVFPVIASTPDIPSQENFLFGNFKYFINSSIIKIKLDFYDRNYLTGLNKYVQKKLGPYIVPSTNIIIPYLPNFFTEGKGPNRNIVVYKNQVLYNGVLGARRIYELRSYIGQEILYNNNVYVIILTYYGGSGNLTIYIIYPTLSNNPQNLIKYRITQFKGQKITDIPETFR